MGRSPPNGWYSVVLDDSAHPYINLQGSTQFRLRFRTDDNNDFMANYVSFHSGNAMDSNNYPRLIIEFFFLP